MDIIKGMDANKHLIANFWVISVINNPMRYARRPELFNNFKNRMEAYGINFLIVEAAYGDRAYEVTNAYNPHHIQLRTSCELWHKENLINIGISRLPATWEYVAWIDADIDFVRKDWALETVHELQHYPVVQMFSDAIDLGPENEVINVFKGFGYCYKNNYPMKTGTNNNIISHRNSEGNMGSKFDNTVIPWHPGYAWAATRDAINTMGGILDFGILGSGDNHMACGFIGEITRSLPGNINEDYKKLAYDWEKRALRLHKNIGYVKGTIYHYWHGKKKDRRYSDRWKILVDNNFNPITDIHKDYQGMWYLHPENCKLRDDVCSYFRCRNEDSIDK